LNLVPADEYCDMPTLLDKIKAEGEKVSAFPIHESWLDIGRHDDLNDARNNIEQWLN
jgi:NDP-sugar pyrophosphorylase family protein